MSDLLLQYLWRILLFIYKLDTRNQSLMRLTGFCCNFLDLPSLTRNSANIVFKSSFSALGREIFICCVHYLGNNAYSCIYPCAFAIKFLIFARVWALTLWTRLIAQSIAKFSQHFPCKIVFQVGCKFSKTLITLAEIYASYLLLSEIKPWRQVNMSVQPPWKKWVLKK